jgi:hypothetical protein
MILITESLLFYTKFIKETKKINLQLLRITPDLFLFLVQFFYVIVNFLELKEHSSIVP